MAACEQLPGTENRERHHLAHTTGKRAAQDEDEDEGEEKGRNNDE
jgi:hypothetical protein